MRVKRQPSTPVFGIAVCWLFWMAALLWLLSVVL